MKLRTKFILVITLLHLVALVLSFYIFKDNKIVFIASELLIIVSVLISWQLYRQMLRPLKTVIDGIEAIKDRDFNVKFLRTGAYEMDQLIDVYNEMMEHLKTERIRQEEQHFFLEKLIHTSPTGILILDFDGKVQQVNPKASLILGLSEKELLKNELTTMDNSLLYEISLLNSGEGKTISLDGVHTYKLQRSHFIDRGFARSFIMIEELTEEILAAEKKAYGKVIRMMAHEVNNTIGPVNSILESATKTTSITDLMKNALQVAIDRNRNLNIFMRNFADVVRLPAPNKNSLDIDELVRHVATLFRYKSAGLRIEIETESVGGPLIVQADQQQIEQALINIIKNAIESIGSDGLVSIRINTDAKTLTVIDSGKGIAAEDAPHLFSPFFSTKKDGQGVGLTLVKEILLNHGFAFSLKTADVGKTVFEVQLNS